MRFFPLFFTRSVSTSAYLFFFARMLNFFMNRPHPRAPFPRSLNFFTCFFTRIFFPRVCWILFFPGLGNLKLVGARPPLTSLQSVMPLWKSCGKHYEGQNSFKILHTLIQSTRDGWMRGPLSPGVAFAIPGTRSGNAAFILGIFPNWKRR